MFLRNLFLRRGNVGVSTKLSKYAGRSDLLPSGLASGREKYYILLVVECIETR